MTDLTIPQEEKVIINIKDFLSEDKINQLKVIENNKEAKESVKIDVTKLDKNERSKIHEAIRQNFNRIETNTKDIGDCKFIIASKIGKNPRRTNQWPKERGDFTHFVLCKRNFDGQQAINKIADKIKVSSKSFYFAGTKDKRAITTQRMCVWRTEPKKIINALQSFAKYLKVGNFTFENNHLRLGELQGNHFEIVLRDIHFDDRKEAEKAIKSICDFGFINYFGMQRFSNSRNSIQVGVKLLKNQWKEAVDLILSPKKYDMKRNHPNAISFNDSMKQWHETQDAKKVFEKFEYKYTPEGMLLKGLCQCKSNDYLNALCKFMPRNMRLMYIHSYQSYLFNKAASHRIQTYGLKVVIGDLLLLSSDESDILQETEDDTESEHGYNVLTPVYADENNINQATIYDIVLPLPGKTTVYPRNETGQFYKNLLAVYELTHNDFDVKSKLWMLHGTYRKLFIKPNYLDWNFIEYSNPNIPLIESDFDLPMDDNLNESQSEDKKLALKFSVSLPSSCYATMLIRELTKQNCEYLESF